MLDFKLCRVVNVVYFGDSPASEFYVPTFQNTTEYSIFCSSVKEAYQHACIVKVHKERGY